MSKLKKLSSNAAEAIKMYPAVLLMGLLGGIMAGLTIDPTHESHQNNFLYSKLALTFCLGISVMFGIKMLATRLGKNLLPHLLGLVALLLFYLSLPAQEKDFTDKYVFVVLPSFVVAHLFVAFAPFLRKDDQLGFWQYNKNLFINIVLTTIFSGVLVGGVMLAIVAVSNLFDIEVPDFVYSRVFFILSITGSTLIFTLFSKGGLQQLESDSSYPQVLKFFTQFVLIPLLLLYAVILYLYSAKILFAWELPRGWVSFMVLAYGLMGILAYLLVFPLKNNNSKSWIKVFSSVYFFSLLPLLVLLFTAIFTRLLEYGFTEPRYYVLLLAVWLSAIALYFIIDKKQNIQFVPKSLSIFIIVALMAPFINAFSVSERSQSQELDKFLKANHLLINGKINFNQSVDEKTVEELSDKLLFLSKRGSQEKILDLIPADKNELRKQIIKNSYSFTSELVGTFTNLKPTSTNKTNIEGGFEIVSQVDLIPLEGFSYLIDLNTENTILIPGSNDKISYDSNPFKMEASVKIIGKNGESVHSLNPFIHQIINSHKNRSGIIRVPEISQTFDLAGYHCKLFIDNINYSEYSRERAEINGIKLLIRKQ